MIYMSGFDTYKFTERMHDYSSLFSYASWTNTLKTGVPSDIQRVYKKYEDEQYFNGQLTYLNYLAWVYRCMLKNYRNEYIYKNELVNKHIYKFFGRTTSVAVNEFRVADAVADLALFNGESKCFEIKSDLDSPQRLSSQLDSYQRVFEQCYIMVPVETVADYQTLVDERVGILTLRYCRNGQVSLNTERLARPNETVDIDVLMRSVLAEEYRWMVKQAYGKLPDVSDFEMFDSCKDVLGHLNDGQLHILFREAVKQRKSKVSNLKKILPMFRQMSISMNMSSNNMLKLENLYNKIIEL